MSNYEGCSIFPVSSKHLFTVFLNSPNFSLRAKTKISLSICEKTSEKEFKHLWRIFPETSLDTLAMMMRKRRKSVQVWYLPKQVNPPSFSPHLGLQEQHWAKFMIQWNSWISLELLALLEEAFCLAAFVPSPASYCINFWITFFNVLSHLFHAIFMFASLP